MSQQSVYEFDTAQEVLIPLGWGWEDHKFYKNGIELSDHEAYEIIQRAKNIGYDDALKHIVSVCNKEIGDF